MAENDNNWVHLKYVCLLLNKPIELYHSTTYLPFLIPLQIFTNVMETSDQVHATKCMM